jgi:riboflavin transporter FmnP
MPKEAVIDIYQKVLNVNSIEMALLVYNVPFTFIKGLISVVVTMFIYKPLSPILHGKKKS